MLGILGQIDPASPFHQHVAGLLDEHLIRNPPGGPAPTPRGARRLLSIGMATYDDYDGVYFSVQAIRLYHPEVTDRSEILVVDNHPGGPCSRPLKDLDRQVAGYRYVPYGRTQGTGVRDVVFREANAEFVLCMDSHVLFRPGALARLVDHLAAHPDSPDLWQGPLVGDDLEVMSTHLEPGWRDGMYGTWAIDRRGLDPHGAPFEIPMQGLGVFGCRRSVWPGFNPRLRGFGGEEGYLHEKIRRAGGRTLCLPFLGWVHRFGRPAGPPYPVSVEDRVRNYLLVHDELGLDPGPAIEHLEQAFGASRVRPLVESVQQELRGPFHFFDALYGICVDREGGRWDSLVQQCTSLGIGHRLRRLAAIDTPHDPRVGRILSHRAVVAEARWLGLENVLVLEEDAELSPRVADALGAGLVDLAGREWSLLSLGAGGGDPEGAAGPGQALQPARGPIGLGAVAYHRRAYERILGEVPAAPTAVVRWLEAHHALDRYYAERFDVLRVAGPRIATRAAPSGPVTRAVPGSR